MKTKKRSIGPIDVRVTSGKTKARLTVKKIKVTVKESRPDRAARLASRIGKARRAEKKQGGVQLTAKCIMGHSWKMTDAQVEEARKFGAAMCPECGNVATVQQANRF